MLVLSCCLVLTVVLVSLILVITVRLLHRATAGSGDSDSTYSPATDNLDTEAYSQRRTDPSHVPQSELHPVYHLGKGSNKIKKFRKNR